MIIQPTTETSEARGVVAVAGVAEKTTKDVPAVTVPTVISPTGAAPVAPRDCLQVTIKEFAVTAVVATVAVPACQCNATK